MIRPSGHLLQTTMRLPEPALSLPKGSPRLWGGWKIHRSSELAEVDTCFLSVRHKSRSVPPVTWLRDWYDPALATIAPAI